MKKTIIAMLVVSFMSFAAVNTVSAQDYQRTEQRTYQRDNGFGGTHQTTITTTHRGDRDRMHDGYHREGTYYGYGHTYRRPYRRDDGRLHNGVEIKVRTHHTEYRND